MMRVSASHLAIIGVGAAAVLTLGTWIYIDVQRELKTLAAANLRSLLACGHCRITCQIRNAG